MEVVLMNLSAKHMHAGADDYNIKHLPCQNEYQKEPRF